MKIYVCMSHILIVFTILSSTHAKAAYDSSKFRDDAEVKLYPVKRKTPNYEQAYYVIAHEEQPDVEYSDNLNNLEGSSAQHYRRVDEPSGLVSNNLQPVREYSGQPSSLFDRQLDLRRQIMQNGKNIRMDRLTKRESDPSLIQSDDSYGMVYRKGRLVGILEPYPQAYELAPLSNIREGIEEIQPLPARQAVNTRCLSNKLPATQQLTGDWDWAKNENPQDAAKFTDEKYPMILTDFKIDSKLSGNSNSYKRDNLQHSMLTGKGPEKNIKCGTGSNEKSNSVFTNSPYYKAGKLQFANSADLTRTKMYSAVKRNVPSLTDEKISELKTALHRMQNPEPSDKVEEIEEDLRGILNDMGLIENEGKTSELVKTKRNVDNQDTADKGQVDREDENLEQGANKIEIVKTTHDLQKNEREKRDDNKDAQTSKIKNEKFPDQELAENSNNLEPDESKLTEDSPELKSEVGVKAESDSEQQNKADADSLGDQETIENTKSASKINIANYQSEGEAYIRSKRQESSTDGSDIMKGLEKSGELTVSGNKSPLACSGNGPELAEKHTDHCSTTTGTNAQKTGLNDVKYETDVERNLQAKIDAIKEEVKREIAALRSKNDVTAKESQESQRKKRDAATTLLEEESSAVNPQEHPEEKLVPYIRRRRNLESVEEHKRTKRGLPDFSNLKNIDTSDYLELNGDQKREDHDTLTDYQVDPQEYKYLPQNLQSADENSNNVDNSKEKRNTVAQQEDLGDVDTSDVNTNNNQDNLESSDNIEKVSERSVDDSSASSSPLLTQQNSVSLPSSSNENEAKQVESINKREENNDQGDSGNNADNLNPQSSVDENQAPLHQQNSVKNENQNLLMHQKEASQNLPSDDIQKRNQINSKSLIDSVVNRNFNEQLKKLNTKPASNEGSLENVGAVKDEVKLSRDNPKDIQQEGSKIAVEPSNNGKIELARNTQNKRFIRDILATNPNLNLETNAIERSNQENIQKLKGNEQEPSRKRRQVEEENQNKPQILYRRRKRANAVMLDGNVAYLPYRADEEEVDDEGDEFDDDGFDDRTASMQKREANDNSQYRRLTDYDNIQEYELPEGYSINNYQPEQKNSLSKRYVAKLNSDVFENPSPGYAGNYLYHPDAYVRRKRQDFNQLVALHGGGPMLHHLAAVRDRNIQHSDELKNRQKFKRSWKMDNQDNKGEPQNIADLSDVDLFGALPQSYEGELSRFKRIKRDTNNVKNKV